MTVAPGDERPVTAHEGIDTALGEVGDLELRPVGEVVEVLGRLHEELHRALDAEPTA